MAISTTPVNQATGNGTSSGYTVTITAPTSGNYLIVLVCTKGNVAPRSITSITCTNVALVPIGTPASQALFRTEMWIGTVSASAGTTVTINFGNTITNSAANITEWSGLLTPVGSVGDAPAVYNAQATNTNPVTGSYTTPSGNDLVISCAGYGSGTSPSVQPGGSWQNLTFSASSTLAGVQGNYIVPAAAGSQSATWTTPSSASITGIVGLKVSPTSQSLSASMSTMDGTETRLTTHLLSASMATMAGAITRKTTHLLAASMATMNGALTEATAYVRSLTASMATMGGTLTKQTTHLLTASMATMAGFLTEKLIPAFTGAGLNVLTRIGTILGGIISDNKTDIGGGGS